MTGGFHLAQINIGRLKAHIDDPQIAVFKDNLDAINALAEGSPGFVWRFTGEGNNATDVQAFDDPLIAINMSVWESVAALGAFVYRSEHVAFMRRRREWPRDGQLHGPVVDARWPQPNAGGSHRAPRHLGAPRADFRSFHLQNTASSPGCGTSASPNSRRMRLENRP